MIQLDLQAAIAVAVIPLLGVAVAWGRAQGELRWIKDGLRSLQQEVKEIREELRQ